MSHYMSDKLCQFYYGEIKKAGSYENAVDNFWNNTLPLYFKRNLMYGIEQEQRPLEGIVKQRADFIIRYVKNGVPKKVVLVEDKRRGLETQSAEWEKALVQLTTYLKLVRTEQYPDVSTLYGAVTIGTYVRFYVLEPKMEIKDYTEQVTPFELSKDEETVHNILTEWVTLTLH